MDRSFPWTQDLIQSVQRQVKTLIERKDAYNVQVLQDWNMFRWSRISLLCDPAAKMIRMKVHVFSDSTSCVGVSNPDPSNNCATKWEDVWNEHGHVEKFNLAAREVQFIWDALKRQIQKHFGRTPGSSNETIIFMCMFNDFDWTKKGDTETCLHNPKEVVAFATRFKPRDWCFVEPKSENSWWNGNSNEPQGKWDTVALQVVDKFKCHASHPIFPAGPLSLGQLRKGGSNFHFQGTSDNKKPLIKTTLASNWWCIYNPICQWYEIEN